MGKGEGAERQGWGAVAWSSGSGNPWAAKGGEFVDKEAVKAQKAGGPLQSSQMAPVRLGISQLQAAENHPQIGSHRKRLTHILERDKCRMDLDKTWSSNSKDSVSSHLYSLHLKASSPHRSQRSPSSYGVGVCASSSIPNRRERILCPRIPIKGPPIGLAEVLWLSLN